MMDWDSDPTLKQLKVEFIQSLQTRLEKVKALESEITCFGINLERIETGLIIAHKLAGVAESYGFPSLTQVASKVEDFLTDQGGQSGQKEVLEFLKLLEDSLAEVLQREEV